MVVRTDAGAARPRVGFVIPRKVGGAVVRNRVRRRLRELLRAVERSGGLAPGDYLVIVAPGAAACEFGQLRHHLDVALDRSARGAP